MLVLLLTLWPIHWQRKSNRSNSRTEMVDNRESVGNIVYIDRSITPSCYSPWQNHFDDVDHHYRHHYKSLHWKGRRKIPNGYQVIFGIARMNRYWSVWNHFCLSLVCLRNRSEYSFESVNLLLMFGWIFSRESVDVILVNNCCHVVSIIFSSIDDTDIDKSQSSSLVAYTSLYRAKYLHFV